MKKLVLTNLFLGVPTENRTQISRFKALRDTTTLWELGVTCGIRTRDPTRGCNHSFSTISSIVAAVNVRKIGPFQETLPINHIGYVTFLLGF